MKNLSLQLTDCTYAWPTSQADIQVTELLSTVKEIAAAQGQLLTLWGSDEKTAKSLFQLHLIFVFWDKGILYICCHLSQQNPVYPDLSSYFPVAQRLQRALFDLWGIQADGSEDQRSWLRHNAWPADIFPLRHEIKPSEQFASGEDHYSFVRVHGEGVHEIPVGPVHAGTIESGHFRFQVVGERILRLEERLGFKHKGIAKHFQHCDFAKGSQLAGRISGDNTVAYAWAYSMALEHLHATEISLRAQWLRVLLLERERVMNHLGDLGALGNDAGLSFGLSQFSRLKENMLRLNFQIFGHRYLMDMIMPGGIKTDLSSVGIRKINAEIQILQHEVQVLQQCYAENQGLQDRFMQTGKVSSQLAQQLGLLGFIARASHIAIDWRSQFPCTLYTEMDFQMRIEKQGDVAARVAIRFNEIAESLKIISFILQNLPIGPIQQPLPEINEPRIGFGCIEGWRGPVFFAVCNENAHQIRWAHAHDSSWQNWPIMEHIVLNDIVPDFPLINKSFNLSYSGHDC